MTRGDYVLYAVNGDRGVAHFATLLGEFATMAAFGQDCPSYTWAPRRLSSGMRCCDLHIDGFTVDVQELLDLSRWGAPHAVLLVETVAPQKLGQDYEIRTYRPRTRGTPLRLTPNPAGP